MKHLKSLAIFSFTLVFFLGLTSFSPENQVTKVPFTKLSGYQRKMGTSPYESTSQLYYRIEQFDSFFEAIKGQAPGKINFGKQVVVTMVFPKSKTETIVNLERINKVDGVWEIYFTSKKGKKLKKETISQGLYLADVDKSIHGVMFYLDGKVHNDLRN
jgi:hypothetical protein